MASDFSAWRKSPHARKIFIVEFVPEDDFYMGEVLHYFSVSTLDYGVCLDGHVVCYDKAMAQIASAIASGELEQYL